MEELKSLLKREIKDWLVNGAGESFHFIENYGKQNHVNHFISKYDNNSYGISSTGQNWRDQIEEKWDLKETLNFLYKNNVVLM